MGLTGVAISDISIEGDVIGTSQPVLVEGKKGLFFRDAALNKRKS